MSLENLRQFARGWLLELADQVWPEEHIAALADQADGLKEQIKVGYDELLRRRRHLERLHRDIAALEQQAAALPRRVESFLQVGNRTGAWRTALQLDEVRADLAANRARLREMESANRALVARLEEDRRTLGQMQMQLLRLRPVRSTAC